MNQDRITAIADRMRSFQAGEDGPFGNNVAKTLLYAMDKYPNEYAAALKVVTK